MGILSWLTGNSKSAEKAVDGVVNGVDAMFFTAEEKAAAMQQAFALKIDFAKHTAFMSISRRVIVCMVTALWGVMVILLVAFGLIFGKDSSSFTLLFEVMKDIVNPPFMIIVAFYFMSQLASKARGKP